MHSMEKFFWVETVVKMMNPIPYKAADANLEAVDNEHYNETRH